MSVPRRIGLTGSIGAGKSTVAALLRARGYEVEIAHTGEDVTSTQLVGLLDSVAALRPIVNVFTGGDESPAVVASAVEFVLEGLHLSKRLNKDSAGTSATYRSKA